MSHHWFLFRLTCSPLQRKFSFISRSYKLSTSDYYFFVPCSPLWMVLVLWLSTVAEGCEFLPSDLDLFLTDLLSRHTCGPVLYIRGQRFIFLLLFLLPSAVAIWAVVFSKDPAVGTLASRWKTWKLGCRRSAHPPVDCIFFPGRLLVFSSFPIYTISGFLRWYGFPRPFFLIPLGFEP